MSGDKPDKQTSQKNADTDKDNASVQKTMSARRDRGDATKAKGSAAGADKRVVSRDIDTGPVNTDRGA